MPDKYTARLALVLDTPLPSVEEVARAAIQARDLDRMTPVRGEGAEAVEVNWGGKMQRAVLRRLTDDDGRHLLRAEAYIGDQGPRTGTIRQASLLQAVARHLGPVGVTGVLDLDARTAHDVAWLHRVAVTGRTFAEAVSHEHEGTGTLWLHTHGAARFDVPDLELYGLTAGRVAAASAALRHVHEQLHVHGLKADLQLPDGRGVYLVPVLQAWQHCELTWPGVGRAGTPRGEGLDGPRATLSLLHRPRFGRFKVDLAGVVDTLPTD